MIISLENISKRFNAEWVFRNVSVSLEHDQVYAITGPNGTGKSTLLRIIAGQLLPSGGRIRHSGHSVHDVFYCVSYAAPYLDIPEEFTLEEVIRFNRQFKTWRNSLTSEEIVLMTGLEKHRRRPVKTFSSGMRQRVKLTLAMLTHSDILILDEPTMNLDSAGVNWYQELLARNSAHRVVVIGSNMEREYTQATAVIDIMQFKPSP